MPAPIAVVLTAQQRRALSRCRSRTKSPQLWKRITAILMSAEGMSVADICSVLSVNPDSVTSWRHRWVQGGLFRMGDAPRTGRPPRGDGGYLGLLQDALQRGPAAFDYIFTVWNVARLGEHMAKKTGVRLGQTRLRQLLHQLGFVFRRPKHTLKSRQNRREVADAKVQLEALKKGLCVRGPRTNCGSRTKPTSIFILT